MMKQMSLILLLSVYLPVSAQSNQVALSSNNDHIKYIGSSKETGSSLATIVDEVPLAHTSQFLPLDKNGKLVGKDNLTKQVNQIFDNISIALKTAGSSVNNIVKVNVWITQSNLIPKVQECLNRHFKAEKKPAVSFVVGNLSHSEALLSMDVIATSTLTDIQVSYFKPEGLFANSQEAAVSVLPVGGAVYVSGQAAKGEIGEATRETLKQLEATLNYLGLKKEDIVQIKSFVCPVADVKAVIREFAAFFKGQTVPPVVYVDWISKDPLVEIELIAASPPKSLSRPKEQLDFITPPGMTESPVYSKVTRLNYGKKIYLSALYGQKSDDSHVEVTDIFTSLKDIIKTAGSDLTHLVKATYYVSNDGTSTALNDLRPKYFDPKRPPAASKAMVKGVGLTGRGVSVDMIGVVTGP